MIQPFQRLSSLTRLSSLLAIPALLLTSWSAAHAGEPTAAKEAAKEVVIAADEWCPYNCDPKGELPGYMVEIAKESLNLVAPNKYRVKYIQLPWERAMRMAKLGKKVHGIIGAIASEAEGLHVPKEAQGMMFAKLFVNKDNDWKFVNPQQMEKDKVKLGAISGYDYADSISNYIKNNPDQVQLVYGDPALPKLLKLLKLERVDTIIEDQAVFWYNVKTLGHSTTDYTVAGGIDEPEALYLAFHDKEVAELVSQGTAKLRSSGSLAKILDKYNLKDWK